MRRSRFVRLAVLAAGAALGLLAGCEPIDPIDDIPVGLSDAICYRNSDCVANACCGVGTNPTHRSEGPDCSAVNCTDSCPANSIDCGRCIPVCRDSRCEAACQ
ncbi:MAG TPA: hypothetical protein VF815_07800 [Myxococcaceae bacterium]|jgi:hypothetical protein